MNRQFRVLLLGTEGVGKTSYTHRLRTGQYPLSSSMNGAKIREITQLSFKMERENISFLVEEHFPLNLLVRKGNRNDPLLKDQFDAVIAMFDQSNLTTATYAQGKAQYVMKEMSRIRKRIVPLVYVGNKSDLVSISKEGTTLKKRLAAEGYYFDISVKEGLNLEIPFIYLARRLASSGIPVRIQTREVLTLLSTVTYDEILEEKLKEEEKEERGEEKEERKEKEMHSISVSGKEDRFERSRQNLNLALIEFITELQKKEEGQVNVRAEVMRTLRDMVSQASPL